MTKENEPSGWAIGWTAFAAIMMIMMGFWWALSGLAAIFQSELFVVGFRWIWALDISTWGWIHLIIGIVVLVAGAFLFRGAAWARVVGVIIAIIAGILSFGWLPYYPIWGLLLIAISVGVIWALTVHGRDIIMA